MKHHLRAFGLASVVSYLVLLPFLPVGERWGWQAPLVVIAFVALAVGGAQMGQPSSPTPVWWIYLCGFLPLVLGLTLTSILAIAVDLEEKKTIAQLPPRLFIAGLAAITALIGWLVSYYRYREADKKGPNQAPLRNASITSTPPSTPEVRRGRS